MTEEVKHFIRRFIIITVLSIFFVCIFIFYLFFYRKEISRFPDAAIVSEEELMLNKEATLFEKYRSLFIPLLSIVAVCVGLLLIMMIDNLKRRRLTAQLQISHNDLQKTYNKLIITEEKLKYQYAENKEYTKYLEKKEAFIRYQAEHDDLTELPNRRSSLKLLNAIIASGEKCTVIIMDIDDFKEINDFYGHACGDEVLREIARRLLGLMINNHFFASRLGGDEFLIIIKKIELKPDSKLMVQLKQLFLVPVVCEEKKHFIKVSMGVAYSSSDNILEAGDIISNADFALYRAKKSGKNDCFFYNSEIKNEVVRRKEIKRILNEACRNDGFYVLYQPQMNTATGNIASYEALTRLKDQSITPGEFIAVAEETETILTLGRIITKKVVEQMSVWQNLGFSLLPVAVNFSSKQLQDKEYVSYLQNLLTEYNISPSLIEIEITESIFINNNEKAMNLFKAFLSIGVRLALDDFGTGYSSINYLTFIPVSKIKVDKTLVDIFLTDGKDALIENIIRLAHCLNLEITVEGVEKQHQYERLKQLGCNYIQGYYFSRPISGAEVFKQKQPAP
jgi:diguanylate cyclase (GGDEF)-like protein